jgi:hypothetical protein
MADYVSETKRQLLKTMDRSIGVAIARRAIPHAPQVGNGGAGLGATDRLILMDDFAVGYDSGTGFNVLPFMLDVSLLDGPAVLTG